MTKKLLSKKERLSLSTKIRTLYLKIAKAEQVLTLLRLVSIPRVAVRQLQKETKSGMKDIPSITSVVGEVLARAFEINAQADSLRKVIGERTHSEQSKVQKWRKELFRLEKEAGHEVVDEIASTIARDGSRKP